MKLVTLMLPEAYLEGLERLVEIGMYPSRSSAIRYAVMDLLKEELWRQKREEEVQMTKKKTNRRETIHRKKRARTLKNRYKKREK